MAKKSRRIHQVQAALSNVSLVRARSSLKLTLYARNTKIGQLEIGRGSLYWSGKRRHRSKRISWTRFAEMMDGLAYGPT